MFQKLKDKFEGYLLSVGFKKGGAIAVKVLTSGSAALWLQSQAQPYLIQYGPVLERFGVHVNPSVFFVSLCTAVAGLIEMALDAHGVTQQNKTETEGEIKP